MESHPSDEPPSPGEGVQMTDNSDVSTCGDQEDSPFYFESDHLALKNNSDYRSLFKTVCMLEVQRAKAIQDLEKLHEKCDTALQDPIGFVQKLQNKEPLDLPGAQRVAVIPEIAWEKYTSSVDITDFGLHKHLTRGKHKETDNQDQNTDKESGMTTNNTLNPTNILDSVVVRGRIRDSSKPSTFNKLWTAEEQRRLEELLIEYPPEKVEAHRFAKIAKALGNRTSQQVASRIQKYFLKLAKARLPIPGRIPKLSDYTKKSGTSRYQKFYHQPSTFLQSYEPPVYMPDDDSGGDEESMPDFSTAGSLSDESSPSDLEGNMATDVLQSEDYQELMQLKQLRKDRLRGQEHHSGYKCDICDMEPIIGSRWHCSQCPDENSVDFCENCVGRPYETETHNSKHRLEQVRVATSRNLMDSDYMRFMPGGYNYLDPNYMPAS